MEQEKNKSLIVSGQEYQTQLTKKYQQKKKWEGFSQRLIKAVLPCHIEKIVAKEGKLYKKGEVLLVFKAMKMSNNLLMPFSGIIKKIHVQKEDTVSKNQLLIEIQ